MRVGRGTFWADQVRTAVLGARDPWLVVVGISDSSIVDISKALSRDDFLYLNFMSEIGFSASSDHHLVA